MPATRPPGVAERIHTAVRKGELSLPPLPEIATRLLGMVRDEDGANLGTISSLMQNDPGLAASVLRIANSAAFGGLGSVPDLGQAIQRLGLRQIGTLVTSVIHKGHFRSQSPHRLELVHRLWELALSSALAARSLADLSSADRIESYLGGLFHDSGKLLVLKGVDEIEGRTTERFGPEEVVELMEALHTTLGYAALQSWKIADPICKIALHHHDPSVPAENALLLRIQAADLIAIRVCSRSERETDPADLIGARPVALLRLEADELRTVTASVVEEFEQAKSLFAQT
jgi:HD-like signal output (HDOD) protein